MQNNFITNKILSDFIKEEALKIGFFQCGISKLKHLKNDEKRMEIWLKKGHNAGMKYLEKNREKRYNPEKLVEGAKSIITVLFNYYPKSLLATDDNFKIAKYAYGKDYHYVIKSKLNNLVKIISEKTGEFNHRVFVDSAPVLDRAWARESGLGFIGKNTTLINKNGGSFFFIGQIISELVLEADISKVAASCGTCTKCIQACPTDALSPFSIDANKCISYLTIENRGEIPDEFNGKFNDFIFGCDICSDVCPWNRFAKANEEPMFAPSEDLKALRKNDWINLDKATFKRIFKGTAFERAGFKGLKRNINFVTKK